MQCQACRDGQSFPPKFSMAFQPIVNVSDGTVYAHEALVRGVNGEGAGSVLSIVDAENRYAFDQQCRVKAIELASQVFPANDAPRLSINFMPNAVYEPRACIKLTLATALKTGFPADRIIFEFTETEKLDTSHVLKILATYREIGFMTAIDDFGAGYSGLGLLAKFQPDIVKLDMDLIRDIDTDGAKTGDRPAYGCDAEGYGCSSSLRRNRNPRRAFSPGGQRRRAHAGLSFLEAGF